MQKSAASGMDCPAGAAEAPARSRGGWWALALLLAGLLVTAFLFHLEKGEAEMAAKQNFDFACKEIQPAIETRLAAHARILRSGAAFFADTDGVTRNEWREFYERRKLGDHLPGSQGIGFALLIPPTQLAQHIEEIRAEGFPDYRIKPEGERDAYSSIIFLEPFSGRNLRAFGYDMFSEPIRRAAMERARDQDDAALSGKVTLVQETDEDVQAGTLMYVPVYRIGMPYGTVAERRAAIQGWVYSPYRMNDLMRGILGQWDLIGRWRIHLKIFDGEAPSPEALLYDSQSVTAAPLRLEDAPNRQEGTDARLSKQTSIEAAGRHWLLSFSLVGESGDGRLAWLELGGGTAISLLLSGLVFALLNTRSNALRIAVRLTADLRQSEEQHRLIFESAGDVIFIHNEDGRMLAVNSLACERLGYSHAELMAMPTGRVDTPAQSRHMPERVARLMEQGQISFETAHQRKDGSPVATEVSARMISWAGQSAIISICRDITERKQAEEKLQKESAILNDVIDRNPLSIQICGLDGRSLRTNSSFIKLFGSTPPADFCLFSDPLILQLGLGDLLAKLRAGKKVQFPECFYNPHDIFPDLPDRQVCISVLGFPILDAGGLPERYVLIHTDITERMRAERSLATLALRNQTLLQSASDGIHILDAQGNVVEANDAFCRMLGYTREEALQLNVADWDAQWPSEELLVKIREIIAHPSVFETRHRRKDGTLFEVEINGIGVSLDGHDYLYSSARDITVRKAMAARLAEALRQAEASAAAKSEFLGVMSHELRTPLSGVLGFAELLANSPLDDEQKSFAQTITKSAEHLLAIINEILDFSSIEAGSMAIHVAPLALSEIVEISAATSGKTAADKGVELRCEVEAGVPDRIIGDARRISQILINLIGNAVKFTDSGSVVLRVSRSGQGAWASRPCEAQGFAAMPISKRTGRPFSLEEESPPTVSGGSFLDFSVEDTGVGISARALARLFAPFTQADPTTSRRFGGTGLGLAITKRLAEAMGGSITVTSIPEKGSTFTFRLPLEIPPSKNGDVILPLCREEPSVGTPLLHSLVLVVDDDQTSRTLAGKMLQGLGDREKCLAAGMDGFLSKPFKRAELAAALQAGQLAHGNEIQ